MKPTSGSNFDFFSNLISTTEFENIRVESTTAEINKESKRKRKTIIHNNLLVYIS